jgi:hypothetical protein
MLTSDYLRRLPALKYEDSTKLYFVGFVVITAVTVKTAVFWDIKTEFVLHRRHITSPLQGQAGYCYVTF